MVSSICVVGFTEISLEYLYILGFQIIFGHVYHMIAIIIALYMAGLSLGGWFAMHSADTQIKRLSRFRSIQGFMVLCIVFFSGVLIILQQIIKDHVLLMTVFSLFTLLLILNGFLGGYQFILAHQSYSAIQSYKHRPGIIYGFDLLGSSAGILLISLFIIPILGIIKALVFLLMLNSIAYAMLAFSRFGNANNLE